MDQTLPHNDDGLSLVEVLVTMMLLLVVGSLVLRATVDTHRVVRVNDDLTQGISDVRNASERLNRDVREARSVLCNPSGTDPALAAADPTCQYHLQLWIDYNSDYSLQTSETVTWRLRASSRPDQFDMERSRGGTTNVVARTVVSNIAFSYDLQPVATEPAPGAPRTRQVNVSMTYDAVRGSGSGDKSVSFSGRLRNVS